MTRSWMRKWREDNGLTMAQAAELLGIERTYYYRIEMGQRTPSVKMAREIARVLKVKRWQSFFVEPRTKKEVV